MSYNRKQVENLLDAWTNEPNQTKNIINCIVSWLAEDPCWLIDNISQVDKEILKEITGRMK